MPHGLSKRLYPTLVSAAIISAIVTALVIWLEAHHHLPKAPDKSFYDWKVSIFSIKIKEQRKDITLIYIDDKSLSDYEYKLPVDRGLLAELIRAVDSAKPKAIGLDFIFDRPSEPTRDEFLISAIQGSSSPIVLAETDANERGMKQEFLAWQETFLSRANKTRSSPFLATEDTGFSLGDDIVRSMEPFDGLRSDKKPFSLALAELSGRSEYPSSRLIDWLLPSEDGKEPFQTFVVPAHKKVSGASGGTDVLPDFMRTYLRDKIVIIGGNQMGIDRHRTPLTVSTNADVAGAHIHAQILAQLLDRRTVSQLPFLGVVMLIFLTSFVLFVAMERYGKNHPEILIEAILLAVIFSASIALYWSNRITVPSSALLMVWFLIAFFGKYVAKISHWVARPYRLSGLKG